MTESRPSRVMAVVVIFERTLDRVDAWPTLRCLLGTNRLQSMPLVQVLIYDNSSQPLARPRDQIDGCTYIHDPENRGTAGAYTCAARLASAAGIDWLLLLDQDTCLPERFLDNACAALETSTETQPAALLPWIYHKTNVVSPARITRTGSIRPLRRGDTLHRGSWITAIASGSLLRVAALVALLPIPGELWLDCVDHWIFTQLHAHRAQVIVSEQVLQHDLSVASPASLSLRRLSSVLDGEAFFINSLGPAARLVYPVRWAFRTLRLAWARPQLALHSLVWMVRRMKGHLS